MSNLTRAVAELSFWLAIPPSISHRPTLFGRNTTTLFAALDIKGLVVGNAIGSAQMLFARRRLQGAHVCAANGRHEGPSLERRRDA